MPDTYPFVKKCGDDVIGIVNKEQADTLFSDLNSVNPHIKFTMEDPGWQ